VWVAFVFGCVGKIDPVAAAGLGGTKVNLFKSHRSDFGAKSANDFSATFQIDILPPKRARHLFDMHQIDSGLFG